MAYEILIKDINKSQKAIGTDKGLAKLGDEVVNLTYSVAKSIFLTKNSQNKVFRTGRKVNRTILSKALKDANMKPFAKTRSDAHDLANTVEALIAYVWLSNQMSINQIIDILAENLSGDLNTPQEETKNASCAFTMLLNYVKKFLPEA